VKQMTVTASIVALLFLPASLEAGQTIPPDLEVREYLALASDELSEASREATLQYHLNQEVGIIAHSDVIVLGTITAMHSERIEGEGICTVATMNVDEYIAGERRGPHLEFAFWGGVVDGVGRANSVAPRIEEGQRLIAALIKRGQGPQDARLFALEDKRVYAIDDGIVERKGIPVGELVAVMRDVLEERLPENLARHADTIIVGTVAAQHTEVRRFTLPSGADWKHDTTLVDVSVSEVLKGSVDLRGGITVSVPDETGLLKLYRPTFAIGEEVLLFLKGSGRGEFQVISDTAGKYRIRRVPGEPVESPGSDVLRRVRASIETPE